MELRPNLTSFRRNVQVEKGNIKNSSSWLELEVRTNPKIFLLPKGFMVTIEGCYMGAGMKSDDYINRYGKLKKEKNKNER